MAAKDDAVAESRGLAERDQQALAGEMADLVYHLLVLAAERGLAPSRVIEVLQERHRRLSHPGNRRTSPAIARRSDSAERREEDAGPVLAIACSSGASRPHPEPSINQLTGMGRYRVHNMAPAPGRQRSLTRRSGWLSGPSHHDEPLATGTEQQVPIGDGGRQRLLGGRHAHAVDGQAALRDGASRLAP